MELKGIFQSLTDDYRNGILSISDVAEELYDAGYTNFIDTEYAKKILELS